LAKDLNEPVSRLDSNHRQGSLAKKISGRHRIFDVIVHADAQHGQVGPVDDPHVKTFIPRWIERIRLERIALKLKI